MLKVIDSELERLNMLSKRRNYLSYIRTICKSLKKYGSNMNAFVRLVYNNVLFIVTHKSAAFKNRDVQKSVFNTINMFQQSFFFSSTMYFPQKKLTKICNFIEFKLLSL